MTGARGTLLGIALAAVSGLLAALAMPRGPVTTTQAVLLLAAAFAVGVIGGATLRSRWALIALPLAHLAVFELGRISAVGPTVDLPRFDSAFGILALLVGRGVFAMLALVPMAVGTGVGLALARNMAGSPVPWLPSGVGVLALVGLSAWLLLPARTPPILGPDGRPFAGSITELAKVRLGGVEQAVLIRGQSTDNPVLLYLSGGPGQSDLPYSRVLFEDLTEHFVVVGWDQRGTGKSYPAIEPTGALTLDQAIADTIELTEYLLARFGEEKVYLLGESWGSTLGVLTAQRRPDLYYAFIGSGQMVSQSLSDRLIWRDLLAYAERTGDWQLYDRVLTLGEPPFDDVPWSNAVMMSHYGKLYRPYTPPRAYLERGSATRLGFYGIMGSEYRLLEKVNVLRGLLDTFALLYPQLQDLDFRHDVTRLEVPIYVFDGQAELRGRREPLLEWLDALVAPIKRVYSFEDAAHSVAFEQFETLTQTLVETILPETYGR